MTRLPPRIVARTAVLLALGAVSGPVHAQGARPALGVPEVHAGADGQFGGRLEARAATDEIAGFGAVEGLYLYGFATGDGTDPAFRLMPDVWSVQPGDTMTFDLENRLPCVPERPEGTHGVTMSETNIHTHGMIVSPNGYAAGAYGDYVFVLADTAEAPGPDDCTAGMAHRGHDKTAGSVSYSIKVPEDHPPGVYWFHPHAHGVSQQQIARGLAGLITVGDIWDYAWLECQLEGEGSDDLCTGEDATLREIALRDRTRTDFVVLKDIQVERGEDGPWRAVEWYDPGFCGDDAYPTLEDGACTPEDADDVPEGVVDRKWLVTVNGQVLPELVMENDAPEILRLANLSASFVYNLELRIDGELIPFQVIANDGVHVGQDADAGVIADGDILLFPSARIEIYLDRGDICAALGAACDGSGKTVVVENVEWECPDGDPMSCGDFWPVGTLMTIRMEGLDRSEAALPLSVETSPIGDDLDALIPEVATRLRTPTCSDGSLPGMPLARGEFRTITFWNGDVGDDETFTMRTDDTPQTEVPAFDPPEDMTPEWLAENGFDAFDHGRTDLCIAAGPVETWVVQNVSDEFHNFHVHQSKFTVTEISGAAGTTRDTGDTVLHDNFPIPPGEWIRIRVRFTNDVAGRFVYHCHILEHEDKGMMSVIEVVPAYERQGALEQFRRLLPGGRVPGGREVGLVLPDPDSCPPEVCCSDDA